MRVGRTSLMLLLNTHTAELRFRRRKEKAGFNDYRRMLCTLDKKLLLSVPGKRILKFIKPHDNLKFSPAAKNLLVVWDIFMQSWRMINCDDVDLIATIKTSPDSSDFWKYFYQRLSEMSSDQKARFMNT
jgi:hypothetical protein